VLSAGKPLVLDADGLNLLARYPDSLKNRSEITVLTPHPGEAARLLETRVAEIESNRFRAVEQLQQRFAAHVVLKGAGSLVAGDASKPLAVCSDGNPGMASGGMGDVLSGVIAGLLAQGLAPDDALCAGVSLHSAAADIAAKQGEIGMLASDLFVAVRKLLNA
jgi:NAD(P)H-hydrate epimerase